MTPRSLRGHKKMFCSCFMVPEGKTGIPDFLTWYPWKSAFFKF